jgi:hypothetical protein
MGGRVLPIHDIDGEFEDTFLTARYYQGGCAVRCEYRPSYGCDEDGPRFYSGAAGILESVNYRTNIYPSTHL